MIKKEISENSEITELSQDKFYDIAAGSISKADAGAMSLR